MKPSYDVTTSLDIDIFYECFYKLAYCIMIWLKYRASGRVPGIACRLFQVSGVYQSYLIYVSIATYALVDCGAYISELGHFRKEQ